MNKESPGKKRQVYLKQVDHIFVTIKNWLNEEKFKLTVVPIEIIEEGDSYLISSLIIETCAGKQVAHLKPKGTNVILAEGLIEVESGWENEHLIYLPAGGPKAQDDLGNEYLVYAGIEQAGWYWDRLHTHPHLLNQVVFWELLSWIS